MSSRTNVTAKRLMDACELLLCKAHALEELTARRNAIRVQATPSRAELVDILPGLVESFAWGWCVTLIFGLLYNFFAPRWR